MNTKRLLILASAVVFLNGCATSSMKNSYDGFDVSKIDPFIKVNQTTAAELREMLGTPAMTATDANGNRIMAFTLVGNRPGGAFGRNVGKSALTLGLGADVWEQTAKNVIFKLDDKGVVIDYKTNGWAWLQKHRFTFWNECDRKLSPAEMRTALNYTVKEIQTTYAQAAAAEKNIPVEDVDMGEEFEWCNIPCHTARGAVEAYGKLTNIEQSVKAEPNDGSRFTMIFPAK